MINDVDEALRVLVKNNVVNGADVEVVFDAPTREWASRRNKPTIDLYLYDIREDLRRRQTGEIERRNEQGIVEQRLAVPRFYKLAYLITAWTQRPEDEHRLLSAILACFLLHEHIPESVMPPLLAELGIPALLQIAYPPPEDRQVSDVWSSLGGDLKPSVDLVVTLAVRPQKLIDIAPAVMAPLRLRTMSQKTIESDDGVRMLRTHTELNGRSATPEPAPASEGTGVKPRKSTRSQGK
jgi:Pvc16 N-terminal domain